MTTYETPIGNTPKAGQDIHLVRWVHRADGWSSETLLCTYLAGTRRDWIVESHGSRVELPREEWAQFAF
ncbi:hypothetical protein LLS1_24940 [Leifsonia sp. LS1]|uniref:hypothetical protein n=1 Tax=Leifsonia sp. LS1 TaxID=2828483 RepID=UPI001CFCE95B|nr:hypothetical protein [Leifsonia sp. LS1]GIT80825.1 hypothetical protein LLS1_24940 [Leifsonia sp. LS1]